MCAVVRTNRNDLFRLPRQLRDQIYGYLLKHEWVESEPWHRRPATVKEKYGSPSRDQSTAHTFRFELSITGTNKDIRDEAIQTLVSNHFVVVSHDWREFRELKHWHDLPIVSEHQSDVFRFKLHQLRVHLRPGPEELRQPQQDSFVIVAADLPVLCSRVVQLPALSMPSPGRFKFYSRISVRLFTTLDPGGRQQDTIAHPFTTWLDLRSIDARASTESERALLLKPFEQMIIPAQKVVITRDKVRAPMSELQDRMGPLVVNFTAHAWRYAELARDYKHSADVLFRQGDFERAFARHSTVVKLHQAHPVPRLPAEAYNSDVEMPIALLSRAVIDAAVMVLTYLIRRTEFNQAYAVIECVRDVMETLSKIPDYELRTRESSSVSWRACRWLQLMIWFNTRPNINTLLSCVHGLREVSEGVDIGRFPELAANVSADLRHVEQVNGTYALREMYLGGAMSAQHRLENTSAYRCPPIIFETPWPEGVTKPACMDDFRYNPDHATH